MGVENSEMDQRDDPDDLQTQELTIGLEQ
jgi:hypothetical protein